MKCFAAALLICGAFALQVAAAAPKAKAGEEKKLAVPLAGQASPAGGATALGDPVAGRIKSESERCQECHGVDGNGHGHEGKFAKLAGQYPAYIVKQIQDFRSGARKHDFMTMMAKSVEDADVVDIAAYFASQPTMREEGAGNPLGKKLFVEGDTGRNLPACASCRGAQGKGNVAGKLTYPAIAGQDARYLEKQLLDWRSGDRKNSVSGTMNTIAKSLTDAEIQALVQYLSGL